MSAAFPLHLMRHGQPVLRDRLLGSTDCAVTPDGIAACVEQADGLVPETIIASDLRRARDCAQAVAGTRTVTIDPRWRELDFGAWDGMASADVDPAALGRFWADPDAAPPPDGERWSALVARIGAALAGLEPRPTLIVTHGGAIRAALAVLCGFSQSQLWSFDLPYAVVVHLRVWPDAPRCAQIVGITPCDG